MPLILALSVLVCSVYHRRHLVEMDPACVVLMKDLSVVLPDELAAHIKEAQMRKKKTNDDPELVFDNFTGIVESESKIIVHCLP